MRYPYTPLRWKRRRLRIGPIKTGARTVKCASGYNLAGLLVGSEGTLGVFNQITLKLIPQPADQRAMMAVFDHADRASETVSAIIASHIVPATLEFMDNFTIRAVEDYSHAGLPVEAAALLLIEVDGHPAQVQEEAERVEALCRRHGAVSIRVARDSSERTKFWRRKPSPPRSCIPGYSRRIKKALDPNNILNPGKIIAAAP